MAARPVERRGARGGPPRARGLAGRARVLAIPARGRAALRGAARHRRRPAALRLPALPHPGRGLARGGGPQRASSAEAIRAEVPGAEVALVPMPAAARGGRARAGGRAPGAAGLRPVRRGRRDLRPADAREAARDGGPGRGPGRGLGPAAAAAARGPVPPTRPRLEALLERHGLRGRAVVDRPRPSRRSCPPTSRPRTSWSTCATPRRARPRPRCCGCWPRAGATVVSDLEHQADFPDGRGRPGRRDGRGGRA